MRPWLLLTSGLLLGSGCFQQGRGVRDRGASGVFEQTREIKAPLQNRCVKFEKSSVRGSCDEALFLAQKYVRGLATRDAICLEGGFGDAPGAGCQARALISDTSNERLLVDIRDAQPGSAWYPHVSSEVWFEEGALVDLYLAEHGY